MPTYGYVCKKCQHQFDEFQSITAKPLRKCPACGQNALKRMIGTGSGIIFKGSGFYCTDYRSDGYKSAAKSDGSTTKSKTDTKKTETTPAPAAETKAEPKEPKKKSA